LGMSMGVLIIVKALIFDVTDDTNSSLGMAFALGGYSLGLIVGPVLGGFLAFPGDTYPERFHPDSVFSKFGALLPCVVIAFGYIIGIISAVIYTPSDTNRKTVAPDIKIEDHGTFQETTNEKTYLIESNIKTENNRMTTYQIQITTPANQLQSKSNNRRISNKFGKSKLGKILMNKGCFRACISYVLYAFIGIGIDELFPLYSATSQEYAGYGFNTSEIGTALMIAAVFVLILQFTVMSRITNYFGLRKSLKYCCLVTILVLPVIPAAYYIENNGMFWFVMVLALIMLRFLIALGFLSINVMINNSCDPELLGIC